MTDNPSSSVPVSKGEEIVRCYAIDEAIAALLALQIDSALASQEARHRAEIKDREMMRDAWERRAHELIAAEARHRQEMEEAKRERERLFFASGEEAVALKERALAAEQREREAGEALQGMLDYADDDGIRGALTMAAIHGYHGTPEGRALNQVRVANAKAALAAIRSAPSPVSAPPTEPFHEQGILHVCKHGRGCDEPPSPRCGPGCAPYDEAQAAFPVEPGSDPQEPETRVKEKA